MAETLRWGILGAAGIARGHVAPAIRGSANGAIMAIASRNAESAASFAAEFGVPRIHVSYESLLADPEVDAVYIPLPNALHAKWAIAAAGHGKAVLCEKPLALTADEAVRVVEAFESRGVPLMEGFMYRFHPQNAHVLDMIREGRIGEVREVRAHLSVDILSAVDADNIRFSPAMGGGSLLDMGCYAVNIVRRIFAAEPATVSGWLDIDERFGVDRSAAGLLGYGDGRLGMVSSSFAAGGQGTYQVIGTDGTIEVPRAVIPGMGSRAAEGMVILVDADGRREERLFSPVDHYRIMVEAFADAVLSGRPVPFPPQDGVANLKVLDAIAASARSGATVSLH